MMQYCPSPEHTRRGTVPWFLSPVPARLCPAHQQAEKPRLRLVAGEWRKVEEDGLGGRI